jgi:hypothetical protein
MNRLLNEDSTKNVSSGIGARLLLMVISGFRILVS